MIDRGSIQESMKLAAITSINSVGKAAWVASVGIGKSYTTLQVLSHYNPPKITWLTNSEQLRDVDAPAEYFKWGMDHLYERTTFMCYQSACKLSGEDLGFVVCDEFDYAITEVYVQAITNNIYDKGLFITGTITEEKRWGLEELEIPLVYEISNQEAQDLAILNRVNFVMVELDLSTTKNRKKVTKYKSWMTSEVEEMQYIENQYIKALIPFLEVKKTIDDHYSRGIPFPQGENYDSLKRKKAQLKKSLDWVNSQRYMFLRSLDTTVEVSKKILLKHWSNPNDKMIVFSGLTDQIDRICNFTYHSKNSKGNTSIEDFNKGNLRVLGVCSALDRGKNMVGLNVGVFESYDSSATKLTQRIGRMSRLDADQEATVYFLLPYYQKKVVNKTTGLVELKRVPTRAVSWLESALVNYRVDNTNSRTINARDL